MKTVRYFSMFSGIGGFELGIQQAAEDLGIKAECVGYSEIDKHAIATYKEHFDHDNYGDATTINPDALPVFDLLVGGFPCQAFSIGGKRLGFDEARGTLFFDIARILAVRQPRFFILENVKGLVNHKGGETFRTILRTLDELGYDVQWQVLNSKDYGVPQSRERVYLVGNLGGTPRPQVFPAPRPGNPYSTVGLTTETAVARTLTAGGNSGRQPQRHDRSWNSQAPAANPSDFMTLPACPPPSQRAAQLQVARKFRRSKSDPLSDALPLSSSSAYKASLMHGPLAATPSATSNAVTLSASRWCATWQLGHLHDRRIGSGAPAVTQGCGHRTETNHARTTGP